MHVTVLLNCFSNLCCLKVPDLYKKVTFSFPKPASKVAVSSQKKVNLWYFHTNKPHHFFSRTGGTTSFTSCFISCFLLPNATTISVFNFVIWLQKYYNGGNTVCGHASHVKVEGS